MLSAVSPIANPTAYGETQEVRPSWSPWVGRPRESGNDIYSAGKLPPKLSGAQLARLSSVPHYRPCRSESCRKWPQPPQDGLPGSTGEAGRITADAKQQCRRRSRAVPRPSLLCDAPKPSGPGPAVHRHGSSSRHRCASHRLPARRLSQRQSAAWRPRVCQSRCWNQPREAARSGIILPMIARC